MTDFPNNKGDVTCQVNTRIFLHTEQARSLITPTVQEIMSTTEVKKCNAELDFPTSALYSIKQMKQYELTMKV